MKTVCFGMERSESLKVSLKVNLLSSIQCHIFTDKSKNKFMLCLCLFEWRKFLMCFSFGLFIIFCVSSLGLFVILGIVFIFYLCYVLCCSPVFLVPYLTYPWSVSLWFSVAPTSPSLPVLHFPLVTAAVNLPFLHSPTYSVFIHLSSALFYEVIQAPFAPTWSPCVFM